MRQWSMRKIFKLITVSGLLIVQVTSICAQSFERRSYDQQELQIVEAKPAQIKTDPYNIPVAYEEKVDPEEYILGPGDELGLNILTSENITYPLRITPTGDLFIPSVGVVHVSGLTLKEAIGITQNYIHSRSYPEAKVDLVLINVRMFKVQIIGAVNDPGFIETTPLERLSDIVEKSGGFHQLAKEFSIEIIRNNGKSETINYLNYLRDGDLKHNPIFQEGDKIIVPFGDIGKEGIVLRGAVEGSGYDIIEPNELLGSYLQRRVNFNEDADLESVVITRKTNGRTEFINVKQEKLFSTRLNAGETIDILWEKGVMVNGFVSTPGGFAFFPGYLAADYISMAGGNTQKGNPNRCEIIHLDGNKERGLGVVIRRGDVIVVPRTLKDSIYGDISALQIFASLLTIYLTFLAAGRG